MNIIVMIHKPALPLVERYGPVWRKFGQRVVAHVNSDCPTSFDWADETVVWGKDAGHHGIGQCRRHLDAIRIATTLEGPTAIVDPDALILKDFKVEDGVLYGSWLWDAWTFKRIKGQVTRWFLHPPYVAAQSTWVEIHAMMAAWCENEQIFDHGWQDRIIGLAANACNPPIRLQEIGFSRNTIAPADVPAMREAVDSGIPLLHGLKNPEFLFYWLLKNNLMNPPTLWEEFGAQPDTKKPPMAMDLLHVEMLRDALLVMKPSVAVEIGSFRGHSTTAFLKAQQDLPEMDLHIVEPTPTTELKHMLSGRPRVFPHKQPFWDLDLEPDFVFIDGDHMFGALADTLHALASGADVIAFHDTHSHSAGLPGCHGSYLAAKTCSEMPGREWLCDHESRSGTWTHRGFGLSVSDKVPEATRAKLRKIFGTSK